MKKIIRRTIATLLGLTLVLSAAACDTTEDDTYKVGIIQMVENGAFDDMREGFIDELREKGYTEDRLEIVYENAQGDASTLSTIARNMDDGSYDLVATIATPPTQAFVNLGSDTPNVFITVSDPIRAGVLTTFESPDKNATGTSNPIPVEGILNVASDLTPDAQHIGILYSSNEINSLSTVEQAKAAMDSMGLTYTDGTVADSSEVRQVAESLLMNTDALFIPNDSTIQNAMPVVIDAAIKSGKVVYGSSAVMVEAGALATVAISDREIGAISAGMAIEILEGASPADIPAQAIEGRLLVLNTTTAEALGLEVPEGLMQNAITLD